MNDSMALSFKPDVDCNNSHVAAGIAQHGARFNVISDYYLSFDPERETA